MDCSVRARRGVSAPTGGAEPSDAVNACRSHLGGWLRKLLGLASLLIWGAVTPAAASSVCGPGAHWIDACPAGIDLFAVTDGVHTVEIFGFGVFNLQTVGPTTVWRGAGLTVPDHHIDTELVSLQLVGGGLTLTAGDGVADGLCSGPLCSMGRITEQSGDPFVADSFFDIFFELQGPPLGPLGPLHNAAPCKMEAVIDRVAPSAGTTYVCSQANGPIALLDANNQVRGQLLFTSHTIRLPEPGTMTLAGVALAAMAAGLRRRTRLQG